MLQICLMLSSAVFFCVFCLMGKGQGRGRGCQGFLRHILVSYLESSPFNLLFNISEKLSEKSSEWKDTIFIPCLNKPRLMDMGDSDSLNSGKLLKTGLNVRWMITSSQMLRYLMLQYLATGVKYKGPETAGKGPCVLHWRSEYPRKAVE